MPNRSTSSKTALSSASNVLQILVLLQQKDALRVVDVSRALGVAGSTAHRLLASLRDQGFVRQQKDSRRYVAGPELLRIARHFSDQNTVERVAHAHMTSLCQEINEAVNLQVLIGQEVLCIDSVVEDRHPLQVRHITGQRVPAVVSAAGKMLLSFLHEPELDAVLVSPGLADKTGAAQQKLLRDELKLVRARGYAINMGEREAGVHAVAVPVFDSTSQPIAALAIAAPAIRLPHVRISRLVQHLQLASAAITEDYLASS